jgi:hypothetical protein
LQSREEARLDKGKSPVSDVQTSNCQVASVSKDGVPWDDSHATSDIACPDYFGLEEVVNDIAFCFWKCSKCLAMDHTVADCMNKIHCRGCYRYGHKEKTCLNKFTKVSGRWVLKWAGTEVSNKSVPVLTLASSASATRQSPLPMPPLSQTEMPPPLSQNGSPPPLSLEPPQPPLIDPLRNPEDMAVFEVDPTPGCRGVSK